MQKLNRNRKLIRCRRSIGTDRLTRKKVSRDKKYISDVMIAGTGFSQGTGSYPGTGSLLGTESSQDAEAHQEQ